ncbi:hypothetical protein [Nannocystis sp. SCPEA4]|uniref:hypothetical protein n=1 Tax=Nannocystis sp. SCPEA4 TaxID=2996787 RepID=UPI002270A64D|nr:hypothetical protein [Nannocystis sp. SCPEA4]MCY1055412.1 hypothetical protein [Nannocystis sp. SCPEA4]
MREQDQDDPGHQDTEPTKALAKKGKEEATAAGADLLKEYLPRTVQTNAGALSVVLGLISLAWTAYHIRKFSKYLEDLALELDCNDPTALAQLLEQHGDEEWCAENLDRGFRKMMEATDPIAKRCILLMVADYTKRKSLPDRAYRQIGSLMSESDEPMLRMILRIAEASSHHERAGIFTFVKYRQHRIAPGDPFRLGVVGPSVHPEVQLQIGEFDDLGEISESSALFEVFDVLVRTSFASTWFGDDSRVHPNLGPIGLVREHVGMLEPHQIKLMQRLKTYMDPVLRDRPPKPH